MTTQPTRPPTTYTPDELAELINIHRTTVVRRARRGQLKGFRPIIAGKTIRFPKAIVDQALGMDTDPRRAA